MAKKNKLREEVLYSRREFLSNLGRYSISATVILAGSSLLKGCNLLGDDADLLPGSSFGNAVNISFNSWVPVSLENDNEKFYTLESESTKAVDFRFSGLDSASEDEFTFALYNSSKTLLELYWIDYETYEISYNFDPERYYFALKKGPGSEPFSISFGIYEEGSSYSDYSDYSVWSNAYSDYSVYSRWSHAYSDWSNFWGNWMQSW